MTNASRAAVGFGNEASIAVAGDEGDLTSFIAADPGVVTLGGCGATCWDGCAWPCSNVFLPSQFRNSRAPRK